ncbi:hypothetical protein [Aeromonas allosaccharophila]
MKPTNKSLLSLPERQIPQPQPDEGEHAPSAAETPAPTVQPAVPAEPSIPPSRLAATVMPAAPIVVVPVALPSVPRARNMLVGALFCVCLALVASFVFIARSHIAVTPLVASGAQPLVEIGVADIDQPEVVYSMDLAFPARETTIPQPVVARRERPAKLKIGVYKQVNNVEKWRRWARQQNVTFEAVQKNRDGEPHYFLYLCEQDPARVDQLKLDVARISGETPQLVRRATSTRI